MADRLLDVAEAVSIRMRRIRQAGTAPELRVRELVRTLGHRFRTEVRTLPGSPDLANQRAGWAIFVHGCFWHGHAGCKLYRLPKTNPEFWQQKVDANRARDRRKNAALRALGLRVVVVWQCELKDAERLLRRLAKLLPP